MRIETKRRIIYLVKKLINYYENPPYLMIETRKLQIIRSRHQYPEGELKILSEDQIHYTSNMALLSELEKHKFIEYLIDYETNIVEAKLKVVLP